jgi:hypothetical protein
MPITNLPTDLIIYITHHLPYAKCTLLLTIFRDVKPLQNNFRWLFQNSKIFYSSTLLQNALKFHNISVDDFYDILKTQSIRPSEVFNLLQAVCTNDITSRNKDSYTLTYHSTFVTPITLNSTLKLCQIMLTVVDYYAQDETKIINNPYHYIHTYINDTILHYFTDVAEHKFRTVDNIKQHIKKFRFTVYTNYWYKSNINLYLIFCLYLANIGIITHKYKEVLVHLASTIPTTHQCEIECDSVLTFVFQYMQLFSANQWLCILFINMVSYISARNLPLHNEYQTDACAYIYNRLMEVDEIDDESKLALTSVMPLLMLK